MHGSSKIRISASNADRAFQIISCWTTLMQQCSLSVIFDNIFIVTFSLLDVPKKFDFQAKSVMQK